MSHFDGLLPFADVFTVIGVITVLSAFFAGLFKLQHWLLQRHDQAAERREHADREAVARLRMKEWMKTNG